MQHYRKAELCRVLNTVPSVKSRALGKEPLCRVPHSAKHGSRQRTSLPSAKHSAKHDPRQSWSLPSVQLSAKHGTRQRLMVVHTVSLCLFAECQTFDTRHRWSLPSAKGMAVGKEFFFVFCLQIFFY